MDSIKNAAALLDECLTNGKDGRDTLYAWFSSEQWLIGRTVAELMMFIADEENSEVEDG